MIDVSTALDLGREALVMALVVAGPILAVGLVVGLGISLFQAVTQLQDQTFALVPKIVAMFAAAAVFTPWIAMRLLEYTRNLLAGAG